MASDSDDALKTVFTGGSVIFLGLIVELGVSFLAKLAIARVLGPVNYGVVSLGVTTMLIVSTLVLLGLNTGIGRYLPRDDEPEYRRGVLVSAFQIALPLAVLAGLGVYVFAPTIATDGFGDPSVTPVLRVFGLIVPLAAVVKLAVGGAQGLQRALPKVYIRNLVLPLTRFGAVLVALSLGFGSLGIAWAYAAAYAGAAAVGLYILFRRTPLFSREIDAVPMHRELLSFSVPLVISTTMTFVFSDIDTFMLGYFASTGDVGVYNTVYPLAQLLIVGMSSFGFIFMPVVSELHEHGDSENMRRIYQIATKWIFIATFPVFAVVALFPTQTIQLTFGSEYVGGDLALVVLSVAFFTHAVAGPNLDALTSIGRTRIIMYDDTLVAIVNFVLNLVLIPRYSFFGAAFATAASYVLLNVLYTLQLYLETGIHPFTSTLARAGLIGSVIIAMLYGLATSLFEMTVFVFVATISVFVLVYSFAIIRFAIEREEIMLVLSFEERYGVDLGPLKTLAQRVMA
ncbi:flippase [Halocatena marina]|uniref:Flippase n=1 Tax=Halocatena marina TaxID=2934937 RepID=A0ABD5YH91_9EURY|nr:flippase [Halocatena marina]